MVIDEKYMWRCLQLAENGRGFTSPNPLVGSVIVSNRKIIGEGFHREFGKPHAEVNAINSIKDKTRLKESILYVSLEPCSHFGKTPPCANLIIESGIPKVVIATEDPFHKVSGSGIQLLRNAGIDVTVGILQQEARKQNKAFFTSHIQKRPYIYLKWAQTKDGFIDKLRKIGEKPNQTLISNTLSMAIMHKLRAETSSILVGTNTVLKDNPSLTSRYWYGKNPVRIIPDKKRRIPTDFKIFDNTVETLVFTEDIKEITQSRKTKFIPLAFGENMLTDLLKKLVDENIDSLMVEGGRNMLQSFIDHNLWDEAYIEFSDKIFINGISAPEIKGSVKDELTIGTSRRIHLSRL